MHDFGTGGSLAIRMPGGEILFLENHLVRVLSIKAFQGMKLVTFRPLPWDYPPEAWPNAWEAVERYFWSIDDPERKNHEPG
jgi:hypothetical protein